MASLSIFFLKFMVAEFPVYMLKQVQQYSKYFLVPLTLLWTFTVFLTSALCAEKLNADFFFPSLCKYSFPLQFRTVCITSLSETLPDCGFLLDGWRKPDWFCVNSYRISHFSVSTLLLEIENKPLNIYSLVLILLSEEAFTSERDMV